MRPRTVKACDLWKRGTQTLEQAHAVSAGTCELPQLPLPEFVIDQAVL